MSLRSCGGRIGERTEICFDPYFSGPPTTVDEVSPGPRLHLQQNRWGEGGGRGGGWVRKLFDRCRSVPGTNSTRPVLVLERVTWELLGQSRRDEVQKVFSKLPSHSKKAPTLLMFDPKPARLPLMTDPFRPWSTRLPDGVPVQEQLVDGEEGSRRLVRGGL